ncbi:MAG: FliA/WhiG family RNA polymerase sigma factor [Planctomycetota bacterium]|nr:FliA/WhiG family RNA polymerase sigma factor [Planctomycetota bacterium]
MPRSSHETRHANALITRHHHIIARRGEHHHCRHPRHLPRPCGSSVTATRTTKRKPQMRSRVERDLLVEQYLPLVHHVLGRLCVSLPNGVERDDLHAVGVLGLIHAAEGYDESRGATFKTYAYTAVRGAILDELRRLDPLPRATRERTRRLERSWHTMAADLGRCPVREEIASHLGCTLAELDEDMASLNTAHVLSIDDASDASQSIGDLLPAPEPQPPLDVAAGKESVSLLARAIAGLPEKARQAIVLYYYEGLLLKDIGVLLGTSESRVSQILSRTMTILRLALEQRQPA